MKSHAAFLTSIDYCVREHETVPAAMSRIAREQLVGAMAASSDPSMAEPERIHEARKCCKRLRAVIRLVMGQDGAFFSEEDAFVRDAARELSWLRDTDAMLDTCAKLRASCRSPGVNRYLSRIQSRLRRLRRRAERGREPEARRLKRFAVRMRNAAERVLFWPVARANEGDLQAGFEESYRGARRAFRRALAEPLQENFHAWRKHVKRHGYHLRLLREIWPEGVRERLSEVDRLGELLGAERDVAMLADLVAGGIRSLRPTRDEAAVIEFVEQRRVGLLADAIERGERLMAGGPADLFARLRSGSEAA